MKTKIKEEFKQKFGELWQSGKPEKPYKDEPYTYYSAENKVWEWIERQLQQARQEGIEEVIKEIKGRKFRKTKYGYRQKGELGTATNGEVCESHNSALEEVLSLLSELKKKANI